MKKYSDSHEWIDMETPDIGRVGISTYARKELGNIVFVELPRLNSHIQAGQEVVVLESTKAAADIYSPVSGKIIAVNSKLVESPELINQTVEEHTWLFKIQLSNLQEMETLMDAQAYEALLNPA